MAAEGEDPSGLGFQWTVVDAPRETGPDPKAGARKGPFAIQAANARGFWERATPQQVKQGLDAGLDEGWEAKCQGFVRALESPCLEGADIQSPQSGLVDGWVLSCFGSAADPGQCPGVERAAHFLPGLDKQSQPCDKEECGEMKEEDLDREAVGTEAQRQRFRGFSYQGAGRSRVVFCRLWELGQLWLKLETHTKGQILELVVLEQFLTVLPLEMQSWVRGGRPETCSQAVSLAEDFLLKQQAEEKQEGQQMDVYFPEEGTAPLDICERLLSKEIKQEHDWETPSLEVHEMICGNEQSQSADATDSDPEEMLAERSKEDAFLSPDQETALEHQLDSHPEKEGDLFVHSQGTYEELQGVVMSQEISKGLGKIVRVEWAESFRERSDLTTHERSPPAEKKYKCLDCGRYSGQQSHLITHERIHTGEKPYMCLECGKSFRQQAHLVEHERIHTGEKPYKCPECKKGFCDRSSLNSHRRTHTGEKPYKCMDCGKCYSRHTSLVDHKRTHTGEKPYKCLKCEKSFSGRSNFNAHERIHIEDKPHKCVDCGKTFTRLSNLTDHKRIHTGEKPYKYKEFGKGFSCSSLLIKHKRNRTGEKP